MILYSIQLFLKKYQVLEFIYIYKGVGREKKTLIENLIMISHIRFIITAVTITDMYIFDQMIPQSLSQRIPYQKIDFFFLIYNVTYSEIIQCCKFWTQKDCF